MSQPPIPPTYLSLADNLPVIRSHLGKSRNTVADHYFASPENIEYIARRLAAQGFRKFKYFSAGMESVLFETTEGQLLRICQKKDMGVPYRHPAILCPIKKFDIKVPYYSEEEGNDPRLTVSIMPRVRTEGVTGDHVKIVQQALLKAGYYVLDMAPENVGLIDIPGREPLPVLIDTGALGRIADLDWASYMDIVAQDLLELPRTSEKKLRARWISPDGTPWQEVSDPRIKTGRPEGVVANKNLIRLEKNLGSDHIIVQKLKAGSYVGDVAAVLRQTDPKELGA